MLIYVVHNISGLLPVKDGFRFLPGAIFQILTTLGQNDELIVVDDHSTDGTKEVLASLASQDSRIKVYINPGSGLVSALNFGLSLSQYNWVARFDIDDKYESNRLSVQRNYISDNVAVIFSDYRFLSTNHQYVGSVPSGVFPAAVSLSLVSGSRTAHPVALLNKSSVLRVGGYISSEFPVEDLGLWIRLSNAGFDLVSAPEFLLGYQISPTSVTMSRRNLVLSKAKALKHGDFLGESFASALSDGNTIVLGYLRMSFGQERQLLFLVDLYRYWFSHSERSVRDLIIVLKLIRHVNVLIAPLTLGKLVHGKMRRIRLRSSEGLKPH